MKQKIDKIFFVTGIVMLTSEIWKQFCLTFIVNDGIYDWWYFPFQLCSIPMYLLVCLPFVRHSKTRSIIYTFLMDYSLLCGIFVFFDTSGMMYPWLPLTIHSFLWHFLLIGLGIAAGLSGQADYTWQGFRRGSLIYAGGCVIATGLNVAIHSYGIINMFYINPYLDMTQSFFAALAAKIGNYPGILCYICTVLAGAYLSHLVWNYRQNKTIAKR